MANLRKTYKQKYGFDWDPHAHDIYIDMVLAKSWKLPEFAGGNKLPAGEHMLRAMRALFTSDQLTISKWTEQHIFDWCEEDFLIIWGCASSSKSNDIGALIVVDWATSPTETYSVLASTSKELLKTRSYEAVLRYFHALKNNPYFLMPGKESRTGTYISNETLLSEDEEHASTAKASIRGVAVRAGSQEDARISLQGSHLPWVRAVFDELSGMLPGTMDARVNLSIGAEKGFKLVGLCNPDSKNDLAGRFSVPLAGWGSVDENTEVWYSEYGKIRHHNGFKSPAIVEPDGAKKYPYLINQKQIDVILKENHGNSDAASIWTMIMGFPPPSGIANALISEGLLTTFHAQDVPVWNSSFTIVAGLDPAFTSDGDSCVLQLGRVGHVVDGRLTVGLGETFQLKLEVSNLRPFSYQILDQVLELQKTYGFEWSHLAIDDSGTQSICDIVEASTGCKVHRVNFGSRASDLPISVANRNPASDVYANKITELYYAFSEYLQCNQIRGLSPDAAHEFCARKLVEGKRPKRLETKADLKKRIKRSPDNADAVACLIGVVRERLGVLPGATAFVPEGARAPEGPAITDEILQMYDLDSHDNYVTPLN